MSFPPDAAAVFCGAQTRADGGSHPLPHCRSPSLVRSLVAADCGVSTSQQERCRGPWCGGGDPGSGWVGRHAVPWESPLVGPSLGFWVPEALKVFLSPQLTRLVLEWTLDLLSRQLCMPVHLVICFKVLKIS